MRSQKKKRCLLWVSLWVAILSISMFSPHKAQATSASKIGVLLVGHGFFYRKSQVFQSCG
ncbi:MAG: hypothetical protein AYP45_05855 [Candidatus Brocadia carolinensis]|uniref:Uncharacterized protein n=1 Tax=Candidatus Brocadia carolinensis TaxID=1004156 RepID=A0A1V4AVA2_9BACT|nr:MAG: hypothetical protein AYP45_05855 [Candidatus Brocadia caroliniensis]